MEQKLTFPQTAAFIPEGSRTIRKKRGAGSAAAVCSLFFVFALGLHMAQSDAASLAELLEGLGVRTRDAVRTFARNEAVEAQQEQAVPTLDVTYYGESPVPVFGQSAVQTQQVQTTAAVEEEPEEIAVTRADTTDWPENVTASVKIPSFPYVLPVSGRVTSPFGQRIHPVDGEEKFHYGVDIAANEGTPVQAFADGTVIYAGVGQINGNYLKIRHDDGYVSLYAHLQERCVEWGETVKAGDTVGLVGQTGVTTGPHLHFQLYRDGLLFDPLLLLGDGLGV